MAPLSPPMRQSTKVFNVSAGRGQRWAMASGGRLDWARGHRAKRLEWASMPRKHGVFSLGYGNRGGPLGVMPWLYEVERLEWATWPQSGKIFKGYFAKETRTYRGGRLPEAGHMNLGVGRLRGRPWLSGSRA